MTGTIEDMHENLLRHEGFVRALARTLVRDAATAEDLAQETWLAALSTGSTPGSPRAWLARILRRRASNLRRGETRRADRERAAARAEVTEGGELAAEDLELQHRVVGAVLALEEPYRGVVIAAYYRGLPPQEIARERNLPPGTVRSQLSRAVELLRSKLDAERGSRSSWSLALVAWLARRPTPGPITAPSNSSQPGTSAQLAHGATFSTAAWISVVAIGGAVVVAISVLVSRPRTGGNETAAAPETSSAPAELLASAGEAPADARAPIARGVELEIAAVDERPASTQGPLDELPAMLVRLRQAKSVLLARALEPESDVVASYAWLSRLPNAGVARIVPRERFGWDLDLPWLDGGGAFWSFTRATHDYQSEPQIGLSKGARELSSGFYGRYEGLVLDCGADVPFDLLVGDPPAVAGRLDAKHRAAWDLLWKPVATDPGFDPHTLATELRRIGFDDDADVEEGHSYLVRAISPNEFDVVAAVQVARAGPDGVTLGWRLLESRPLPPSAGPSGPKARRESPESLPAPPTALVEMDDRGLRAEIEALRDRGSKLLLERMPDELAARASTLEGLTDAGIARILDRAKPWTEFPRMREGGAYFSFADRGREYGEASDVYLEQGRLGGGGPGLNCGWILEVGDVPLEGIRGLPSAAQTEAGRFLWTMELPGQETRVRFAEAVARARTQADDLGLLRYVEARPNTTWLLRSIAVEEHDVLVALRCVGSDDYGAFIEWRILKTWPAPAPAGGIRNR